MIDNDPTKKFQNYKAAAKNKSVLMQRGKLNVLFLMLLVRLIYTWGDTKVLTREVERSM